MTQADNGVSRYPEKECESRGSNPDTLRCQILSLVDAPAPGQSSREEHRTEPHGIAPSSTEHVTADVTWPTVTDATCYCHGDPHPEGLCGYVPARGTGVRQLTLPPINSLILRVLAEMHAVRWPEGWRPDSHGASMVKP